MNPFFSSAMASRQWRNKIAKRSMLDMLSGSDPITASGSTTECAALDLGTDASRLPNVSMKATPSAGSTLNSTTYEFPKSADPIVPEIFTDAQDEVCDQPLPSFPSIASDTDSDTEHDSEDGMQHPSRNKLTLADELFLFFIVTNLPRRAMQELLSILCRHGVDVPSSVYKLNKEREVSRFTEFGNFAYLSIEDNLGFCFKNSLLRFSELRCNSGQFLINMHVNIDGLPLFKSSQMSLWPILIRFENYFRPLPVAVFCGYGKPDLTTFLSKFIEDINIFKNIGIKIFENIIFLDEIVFLCDAPARAYLQSIKGHCAFDGCGYCRQQGVRQNDRVVFSTVSGSDRTDLDYLHFRENNQLQLSPLIKVVPLKSAFPPEYMHLLCLGVCRKLFHFYFRPTKHLRLTCKLSSKLIFDLSSSIRFVKPFIPSDFQRKPRGLNDLEYFKATEFRMFLLYLGPYMFKKYLPLSYYNHFCLLHFATYVFCSPKMSNLYHHAQQCLNLFVHQMPSLFGQQSVSYNVHVLLHLKDFVEKYGSLDSWSTFPFENFLGKLKKRIHPTRGILQQTKNQLINLRTMNNMHPLNDFHFGAHSPNNCFLLPDGQPILFFNSMSAHVLRYVRSLYSYPYDSVTLHIGFYEKTRQIVNNVQPVQKAICIPSENLFLIIPYVSIS